MKKKRLIQCSLQLRALGVLKRDIDFPKMMAHNISAPTTVTGSSRKAPMENPAAMNTTEPIDWDLREVCHLKNLSPQIAQIFLFFRSLKGSENWRRLVLVPLKWKKP